jgi:hypothetical protein
VTGIEAVKLAAVTARAVAPAEADAYWEMSELPGYAHGFADGLFQAVSLLQEAGQQERALADRIHAVLNEPGQWSPDTLDRIANLLAAAGYEFADHAEAS